MKIDLKIGNPIAKMGIILFSDLAYIGPFQVTGVIPDILAWFPIENLVDEYEKEILSSTSTGIKTP